MIWFHLAIHTACIFLLGTLFGMWLEEKLGEATP